MPDNDNVISVGITADAGALSSTMAKMTAEVKASLATLEAAFKQANLELKLAPRLDPAQAGQIKEQQQQLEYQVDYTKAMLGRLTLEWQRAAERVKAAQTQMAAGGSSSDLSAALASQQAIAERMARFQQMSASAAANPGQAAQTASVEAGQTAQQAAIQKTAEVQAESSAAQVESVEAQTAAEIEATEAAAAIRQATDAANTEAYLARATAQAAANRARVAQAVEGEGAQAAAALKTTAATEATSAAARQNGAATVQAMAAGSGSASMLALRLSLLTEQHAQAARAVRSYAQESLQAAETAAALGRTGSEAAAQITANLEAAIVKERELAAAVEQATIELEKMDGVVQHVAGSMLNAQIAGQAMRETIGVGIPRAMERVMSMSPLMGAALQLAMPVFMAVMIAEAIEKIVEKVMAWRDGLADIKEYNETIGRDLDKLAETNLALKKENQEANFKLIGVQQGPAAEQKARAEAAKTQHEIDVEAVKQAQAISDAATKRYQDAHRMVREADAAAAVKAVPASGLDAEIARYRFAPPPPPNPALDEARKGLGIEGGLFGSQTETLHNPLADAMREAALTLEKAQQTAKLSESNIGIDTGKEAKDRAREMVAKLKAADQEALADEKDDHKLSLAEEIAFWAARSHIQAGYLERDREIRHTIAQLHQAQFEEQAHNRTQAADATAGAMVRSDDSPDYAAREAYWARMIAIDKAGLILRVRTQEELDHAIAEANKNGAARMKQAAEDAVRAAEEAFKRLEAGGKLSVSEIGAFWTAIADKAVPGSELYKYAMDKVLEAQGKFIDQEKQLAAAVETAAAEQKKALLDLQTTALTAGKGLGIGPKQPSPFSQTTGPNGATGVGSTLGAGGKTPGLFSMASLVTLGAAASPELQELQQQKSLHDQEYQLAMQAQQKMEALYAQDPLALQKVKEKERAITDQYNKQNLQTTIAEIKALEHQWQQFFNTFNQGFTQAMNKAITTGKGFGLSMKQLYNQMLLQLIDYVAETILKDAEGYLIRELAHTAFGAAITAIETTMAGTATATKAAAQAAQAPIDAAAAISSVGTAAAESMVWGAAAGGPPGAIAAAAATTAAGAPFIAAASAERGGIVPNAITSAILHPNEMVLPAPLSQGFQRMLGTGGGGSAGNTHLHYSPTVHAYGAGGLEEMLKSHASTIHQIVKRGQRTGHLPA